MELARATAAFERAGGVLGTSEAFSSGIEERTLYWMRDTGLVEPLSPRGGSTILPRCRCLHTPA